MKTFESALEAQAYVAEKVDVPALERREQLGRAAFTALSLDLGNGKFTNVYDVSYRDGELTPEMQVLPRLQSIYELACEQPTATAAIGGGFFYLADRASGIPRQLALNMAITNGRVHSLPVVDREGILLDGRRLSAKVIQSLGILSINGQELSWSGSLTAHETDVKVFSNGNAAITHEHSEATGSMRVLDERSRFTPQITDDETVDIGFISREDGSFVSRDISRSGSLDLFSHDVVVRCHERYVSDEIAMRVHSIGDTALKGSLLSGLSVGPMLDTVDFNAHAINKDASLGAKPPFVDRPIARTALYKSEDGRVHIRLYDGRPGSEIFTGVTPTQLVESIKSEGEIEWGVFLDGGQTAKIGLRTENGMEGLGNTHYLKWPTEEGGKYVWVPEVGRPVGSAIVVS